MNYLIPANAKKSGLIFGMFNKFDMILLAIGVGVSIMLLMVLPIDSIKYAIIAVLPGAVTGFLVFPIPNYHNVLTVIINIISFYTTRQEFVWKGWCVNSEQEDENE